MQIVCQSVGRAQRNDAQSSIAADHALQNVMRRAVAATGKDGVATLGDGMARLLGRIRLAPRGLGGCLDSGLMQHGQGRFNVRQPPLAATARQRVVEEARPCAWSQWDCTENEFRQVTGAVQRQTDNVKYLKDVTSEGSASTPPE